MEGLDKYWETYVTKLSIPYLPDVAEGIGAMSVLFPSSSPVTMAVSDVADVWLFLLFLPLTNFSMAERISRLFTSQEYSWLLKAYGEREQGII